MFRTITAKFPDTCKRCSGDIHKGDRIRYGGPGRVYHFAAECGAQYRAASVRGEADVDSLIDAQNAAITAEYGR